MPRLMLVRALMHSPSSRIRTPGGVLVGTATDLARLRLGPLEQLAGTLLRRPDQLALLQHLRCLLLRTADDRVALIASTLRDACRLPR